MKGVRLSVLLLLAAAALAGCSAGHPSPASPAPLAPANSLVYLDLTVQPQGSERTSIETAITRLIGHSPNAAIQRLATKAFQRAGLSYSNDIAPWLGQHIGIVVTAFSRTGLGLIAPTGEPHAALATLKRVVAKGGRLTPAHYAGVTFDTAEHNGSPVAVGIVGHAAVVGAPGVFRAIVDAYHGRSLAHTPAFVSAFSHLPEASLVRGYVNAAALGTALHRALASVPSFGPSGGLRGLVAGALAKLRGTVSFALSATAHSLALDFRSTAPQAHPTADVGGLPEQSWLAVAAARFNPARLKSFVHFALRANPAATLALAAFRAHFGIDLVHDVLPALGPFQISVQGTSPLTLGAGIVIRPTSLAAAQRVLGSIRRLAARSSSLSVQGGQRSFTITKRGLPIPRVLVTQTGGQVVITFDESAAQVLSPSTHLDSSPRFTAAREQLPGGSRVPLFLDFRTLGQLLQQLPGFTTNPNDQKLLAVVQRLDYLVFGSNQARGQARLVLGLR